MALKFIHLWKQKGLQCSYSTLLINILYFFYRMFILTLDQ